MTHTTLIRWSGIVLTMLIACGFGSHIAVSRHEDDASVLRAQAEATKAHEEAIGDRALADKAMWDKMPEPLKPPPAPSR